jgi:hypothetical protein
MIGIAERLDPDRWIAERKSLLDYPMLKPSSLQFCLVDVVFGDKRELATHLGQWMARVAEARSPERALNVNNDPSRRVETSAPRLDRSSTGVVLGRSRFKQVDDIVQGYGRYG